MAIERKPFAIRFPVDLHEDLKLHAFLTGESMAATINRLVRSYLDSDGYAAMADAKTLRKDALGWDL